MPVAGGEPKPSVVVLHPEHARPPTDTVMTFIAMMSHPLRGWCRLDGPAGRAIRAHVHGPRLAVRCRVCQVAPQTRTARTKRTMRSPLR